MLTDSQGTTHKKGKAKSKGSVKSNANPTTLNLTNFLVDETDAPCRICSKLIGDDKSIQCDACEGWIHQKCSDLTMQDYDVLRKTKSSSIKWVCPVCEKNKGFDLGDKQAASDSKISALMTIVQTMQQQIQVMMGILQNKESKSVEEEIKENIMDSLDEKRERESRKNNLVVFNVTETEENQEKDNSVLTDIVKDICPEVFDKGNPIEKIVRLGKSQKGKPRPTKIIFKENRSESRRTVLRNAHKLKDSNTFKGVVIVPDKTLKERECDKKLYQEMKKMNEEGKNVMIRGGKIIPRQGSN